MSRLTNVIEAVKASRIGENRAWIYDENGNISDEVICGDVIPFLEELKEYEIEKSDEFIEDFIKDADNFYTYNYGCAIDKDISAWYKNDNPIMIVCVHLFGDARWGFSDYFVVEMNDYYDGTPLTQFLQLESVYQTVDINDKKMAQIVRKYFFLRHFCILAQSFHIRPDIGSIQRLSVFRDEDGVAFYFLRFTVLL